MEQVISVKIKTLMEGLSQVKEMAATLYALKGSLDSASQAADANSVLSFLKSVQSSAQTTGAAVDGMGDKLAGAMAKGGQSAEMAASLEQVATSAESSSVALEGLGATLSGMAGGTEAEKAKLEGMGKAFSDNAKQAQAAASILAKWEASQKGAGAVTSQFSSVTDLLGQHLGAAAGHAGNAAALMDGLGGVFSSMLAEATPVTSSISGLKDALGGLLTTALTLAGIKFSFDFLKDTADYAARTETLGVTLNVVGKNAGYTEQQLSGYEVALKKLGITTQSARESMTQMIQAGLPLAAVAGQSTANVERLARASQDLAVVTGQNSSETFSRLITNIQQRDTMGLRFMGLTVNMQEAEERFALSIGKTADALNQQQRVQAVNNAVLDEATKLQGAYEASMDTVGKKVQSLKRYKEELSNAIGEKLIPSYAAAVDSVTKFLSETEKAVRGVDQFGNAAKDMGDGTRAAFDGVNNFTGSIIKFFLEAYEAAGPLVEEIGRLAGGLFDLLAAPIQLLNYLHLFPAALRVVEFGVAGIMDAFKLLAAMGMASLGGLLQAVGLLGTGIAKTISLFDKDAGKGIQQASDAASKMGENMVGAAGEMYDAFAKGDSEVQRVVRSIVDADTALSKFGKQTSFMGLESAIAGLKRGLAENKITSVEAGVAIKDLSRNIDELAKAGNLSEKEVSRLKVSLAGIASDESRRASEALKNIGTTAVEATTGVGEKFGQISGSLVDLAANSTVAGEIFSGAFEKGLDAAKTVAEFGALGASIEELQNRLKTLEKATALAKVAGDTAKLNDLTKESANLQEALQASLGNASLAYGGVLAASLKAANSQADLDIMVRGAAKAFNSGMISAQQYASALAQITVKREELEAAMSAPMTSNALSSIGSSLSQFSSGITAEGKNILAALDDVVAEGALKGADLGRYFAESFRKAKTEEEVSAISARLQDLSKEGKLAGNDLTGALQTGNNAFIKLSDAGIKGADSVAAVAREASKLQGAFQSGVIGADELAVRLQLIATKTRELTFNDAFQGLVVGLQSVGVNAQEVVTGVSKVGENISAAFAGIASSSGMTSDQIYRAFNGILAKAGTLEDLSRVKAGVDDLAKAGTLSGQELVSANQRVGISFRTLFERDLKAAKTKEEFDQLRTKVQEFGNAGVISGSQLYASLSRVSEAASGNREQMVRSAKNFAEMAAAQASVARAQVTAAQRGAAVTRSETELLIARNRAENDGSEEAKQYVAIKEKALQIAQSEKAAADAAVAAEIAGMRQKQAEQEKINALKKQEYSDTPENAAAVEMATKRAELAEQEYSLKVAQRDLTDTTTAKLQGELAIEEQKLEKIKQQNIEKGNAPTPGEGGGQGAAPSGSADYEKNRDRPSGALSSGGTPSNLFKIAGLMRNDDIQKQLEEAGYGNAIVKQQQMLNQARLNVGPVSGMSDWDRVFQGISQSKKEMDALVKASKDAQAAAAAFADQYNKVAQRAQDAELGIAGLVEEHHGLSDESGKLAEVYNGIRRNAASAAKSIADSARSYAASMNDLEAQLAEANGDSYAASEMRMEQKRKEMQLEHALMVAKLQTARVQAAAAGISTGNIDQALADVETAFSKGMDASEQLHQKDLANIRDKQAKEAAAAKEDPRKGSEQDINVEKERGASIVRQSNVLSLQDARDRLRSEQSITEERKKQFDLAAAPSASASKGSSREVLRRYTVEQMAGVESRLVPSNTVQTTAISDQARVTANRAGVVRPVDMVQVDLNMNGQKATTYVPPEQKDDFMDRLKAARKVAL